MSDESTKQVLALTIGEHDFRIRVQPEEAERYRRIEKAANAALNQVQQGSGALAGPRALAMALFQVSVELDDVRLTRMEAKEGGERLRQLIARIDQATERKQS